MSQCVPNWEIEEQPNSSRGLPLNSTSVTATAVATTANIGSSGRRTDYEVAELTWVDGHPSMHGLGQPRLGKSMPKCPSPTSWGKAIAGGAGTLESVVDQATGAILFPSAQSPMATTDYDLVPWITPSQRRNCSSAATASVSAIVMDALVPCANRANGLIDDNSTRVPEPPNGDGCDVAGRKRRRDRNCSVSGSAASLGLPFDTCDINGGGDDVGFTTSTSPVDCSPDTENTSCGRAVTVADEHDSASHSRRSQREDEGEEKRKAGNLMRSSVSTKRSRAAAVHNQSERKRRDRINQRMKTLQKLVPNSSKTDKASMLDEVIDYLKQLQAQIQMMNRMNTIPQMMNRMNTIPQMMMPMPMPMTMTMQQLQMAMMAQMTQMAQMGMGMGMAMGMDMNMNTSLARPSNQHPTPVATPPSIQPSAFFPFFNPSWDGSGDRQSQVAGSVLPVDPLSAFMTCQAQKNPMTMDAFGRMASMYQQLYQQPSQQNQNPNPKQQ